MSSKANYQQYGPEELRSMVHHRDAQIVDLKAERDEQRARAERAELATKAWFAWESHRYGCAGCRTQKAPTICGEGSPLWNKAMALTEAALTAAADEGASDA